MFSSTATFVKATRIRRLKRCERVATRKMGRERGEKERQKGIKNRATRRNWTGEQLSKLGRAWNIIRWPSTLLQLDGKLVAITNTDNEAGLRCQILAIASTRNGILPCKRYRERTDCVCVCVCVDVVGQKFWNQIQIRSSLYPSPFVTIQK